MERKDTKKDIFAIQSTCIEISVSLSCLFVHEPPYQNYSSDCVAVPFFTAVIRTWTTLLFSSVLHVSVGLAQAHPNNILQPSYAQNNSQLCINYNS